jgi:hypothetical protein
MRIYEGRPRQDYEEVFRSLGGFIDQRGMRGVLILEVPDGFVLHGLAIIPNENDVGGRIEKESYTFLDEDVARFMEESRLRRGTRLDGVPAVAGPYERALRVLGAYIDQQQPRDVFLMEQEGSWLLRLLMGVRTGIQHVLVEFTPDEIAARADQAPALRGPG